MSVIESFLLRILKRDSLPYVCIFHCQPSTICSSTSVLKKQKGNCFEFSILLTSLLIGAGYDAYCVCGYATRETTLMDETREICPMLKKKDEVKLTFEDKVKCLMS